jgi:bifunctional DNA-binding transcriptional regulator/antitoxin component of YhaV-PrlF toxin-antitoxin module
MGLRTLSYHPAREGADCPCLLIGNRRIAKKYGWQVGDCVEVVETDEGILIKKSDYQPPVCPKHGIKLEFYGLGKEKVGICSKCRNVVSKITKGGETGDCFKREGRAEGSGR